MNDVVKTKIAVAAVPPINIKAIVSFKYMKEVSYANSIDATGGASGTRADLKRCFVGTKPNEPLTGS